MILEEVAPKRIQKPSASQQKKLTALRKDIRFQKSKAKIPINQSVAIFLNQTPAQIDSANPKRMA